MHDFSKRAPPPLSPNQTRAAGSAARLRTVRPPGPRRELGPARRSLRPMGGRVSLARPISARFLPPSGQWGGRSRAVCHIQTGSGARSEPRSGPAAVSVSAAGLGRETQRGCRGRVGEQRSEGGWMRGPAGVLVLVCDEPAEVLGRAPRQPRGCGFAGLPARRARKPARVFSPHGLCLCHIASPTPLLFSLLFSPILHLGVLSFLSVTLEFNIFLFSFFASIANCFKLAALFLSVGSFCFPFKRILTQGL